MIYEHILTDLLDKTQGEIHRAYAKHGDESMVSLEGDVGRRLGILGEEFGEVCTATTYDRGDPDELYGELIQLAAMALSWAHVLDVQRKPDDG